MLADLLVKYYPGLKADIWNSSCREGAMAARKWDSLGTLIAGAVVMAAIVALLIWWGYHARHVLNP